MSALLATSVVELVKRVHSGELQPLDVVDAHIDAVQRHNPKLNAVVAQRFEAARDEARAQGEQLSAQRRQHATLPALAGVPFTVKECFGVAGMPHTVGNLRRSHITATTDATVVQRLRAAGGIVIGVTNMPEMAMGMECDNLVYGRTNNPHDVTRTCGGSSGGEGSIVGVGASPFGVASDIGGSIRMPSLFCGTFGHKPSGGLVPGGGHVPAPSARAARFTAYGPICRSARDLMPLLRIMAGADDVTGSLGDPSTIRIEDLRVLTVIDDGRHTIDDSMKAAQARAASALQARGAHVQITVLPELKAAFDLWGDALRQTADKSFGAWLGEGEEIKLRDEVPRALIGRRRHTDMALLFVALERLSARVPLVRGGFAKMLAFKDRLQALLKHDGVLLLPPFPSTAPRHGHTLRTPRGFVLSGLWNMLEMPCTSVPIGKDGAGLPTGTQVIGPPGADARTIAVALALDAALCGFQPPEFV